MNLLSKENILKGAVLVIGFIAQGFLLFYNVRSEIHDNKTNYEADKRIIEFRLSALDECCNGKYATKKEELTFSSITGR